MIQDSLYASYIKEREGLRVFESQTGFATYKINADEFFIADFYVAPEKRKFGAGRALLFELERIALSHKCKRLTANIHLNIRGSEVTLPAALACGFEVKRAEYNVLLIVKELEDS